MRACSATSAASSIVSVCLASSTSGTPIMPTSCSSAPFITIWHSSGDMPSFSQSRTAYAATRCTCPPLRGSLFPSALVSVMMMFSLESSSLRSPRIRASERMRVRSSSLLIGLLRKSSAPHSSALILSSVPVSAVSIRIGIVRPIAVSLMNPHA